MKESQIDNLVVGRILRNIVASVVRCTYNDFGSINHHLFVRIHVESCFIAKQCNRIQIVFAVHINICCTNHFGTIVAIIGNFLVYSHQKHHYSAIAAVAVRRKPSITLARVGNKHDIVEWRIDGKIDIYRSCPIAFGGIECSTKYIVSTHRIVPFRAKIQSFSIGKKVGIIFVEFGIYRIAQPLGLRPLASIEFIHSINIFTSDILFAVAAVINYLMCVAKKNQLLIALFFVVFGHQEFGFGTYAAAKFGDIVRTEKIVECNLVALHHHKRTQILEQRNTVVAHG